MVSTVLPWLSVFAQSGRQGEWEQVIAAANREGKVVVGVPASAALRKALEKEFADRFPGIQLELIPGRGSALARKILAEYKAGVSNFDLVLGGPGSFFRILSAKVAEPLEPYMILQEVKDPKYWWGGHIWADNLSGKRFVYSFQAYMPDLIWYNADLVKPGEIRSYDDLLNPKWKGKMGFVDPRTPGAGWALWAYMRLAMGENFLKKLAGQDFLLSRNQRQLGDFLAKGRVSLVLGSSYYQLVPFIKAGLPVKPLPILKEGINATSGAGAVTIIKSPPHPNAAKVFVNWLLTKEGQEIYGKAMGQATRRLDVDTKWMKKTGVSAAKDFLTVEEYFKRQIDLEDKYTTIRKPATALAKKLLK